MRSLDILVLADCRFPGGTSSSIAQELRVLGSMGLRVGLVHVPVAKLRSDRPLHPALLDAWNRGLAERIEADEPIAAEVVIAQNPYAFAHRPLPPMAIRTGKRLLVVHHTPLDGRRWLNYDPWAVARHLRPGLGGTAVWAPISQLCRQNMVDAELTAPVLRDDWRNIVAADDWGGPRARPLGPMVSMGRHSRPQLDKWPPTRAELFAAYPPDDEDVRVRLLGVDEQLEALAGGWPHGWEVFGFNEIAPQEFVQTIDFFVYYHHPCWVETFGRCTAEAIASGAVAILPPYMRTNFGDAAVYCAADEAVATARRIHADPDLYAQLSRRGREIIARDYGPERYRSLVHRVLEAPADMAELVEQHGLGLRTLRTYIALRLAPSARTQLWGAAERRRDIRKRIRRGTKALRTSLRRPEGAAAGGRRAPSRPAALEPINMLLSFKKTIKKPIKKIISSIKNTQQPCSAVKSIKTSNKGAPPPSTCVEPRARPSRDSHYKRFEGSEAYWEERYRSGRNSGTGSYGHFAEFKAAFINNFVKKNNVETVIEFGCGDGSQLTLADYKNYIGLDVSETAVKLCISRFDCDTTKSFFVYKPGTFKDNHNVFLCDLALSLDVIYHLVEYDIFAQYMIDLFSCSCRFVIIYSSNCDHYHPAIHVRHRTFTKWIENNEPDWILMERINNKYPYQGDDKLGSWSDFFIYENQRAHDRVAG